MKKIGKPMEQGGFTLIELMIVVAIIGILAAVAIPKFAEMLRKSKEGATKGSLTNMRSALTIYISDNEGVVPLGTAGPTTSADLDTAMLPKYMDAFPTAKLGTYHSDGSARRIIFAFDGNRSSDTVTTDLFSTQAWNYTSNGGGSFWVNCSHTDTKNVRITFW